MSILLTTTGTASPLIFNDLSGRIITHPVTNLDLNLEFGLDVIANSTSLQSAITSGHITLRDENNTAITNISKLLTTQYILDKNLNNIADDSDRLGTQLPAYYLNRSNQTGTQLANTISNFSDAADARIAASSINALNDVNTTGVLNNYVLKYDTATLNWIPVNIGTLVSNPVTNYVERFATITPPTVASTWQTRTLEFANAFVFIVINTANSVSTVGVRLQGSSLVRTFATTADIITVTAVTNASSQIQIFSNRLGNGITFTVIGYIV